MVNKGIFLEYIRLIRLSTAGNEIGVILLGGFLMGMQDVQSILLLVLLGLFGHIFGYTLNEYVDIEVDKKLTYNIKKPLVSGIIPKSHALIIVFISGICTYVITLSFFFSLTAILLLTVALILTMVYDIYGKKIPFSDFVVAGTLGLFLLFGASTFSQNFTGVVYIASVVFFLDVVFMNFVEGGLKDIDHDAEAGAKTMASRMGVHVKDDTLVITMKFKIFAYILRIFYFGLIILVGFQPEINLWYSNFNILHVLAALLAVVVIVSSYKLLHFPVFDKTKMYKLFAIINISSVSLLLIMVYPIIGLWAILTLFLLPLLWYAILNRLMYEKALQPLV